MVALVIILSGFAGLAASALVWFLDAGFMVTALAYLIVGNLTFAVLSGLAMTERGDEAKPDFTRAIQADLQALLEERLNAAVRNQPEVRTPRFPLLRRRGITLPGSSKATGSARTRTLFR